MKKFLTIKPKIENLLMKALKKHHLQIYEINNFHDFENDVLQILVEDINEKNRSLDFATLTIVNEEISEILDQVEELNEPYLLEVASAGVEKNIRNFEEMQKAMNHYLHLEFKTPVAKLEVVEGYLKGYDSTYDEFLVEYFVKGQLKKINFSWKKIAQARYAVKF